MMLLYLVSGSFESCQSSLGGRLECFRAVTRLRALTSIWTTNGTVSGDTATAISATLQNPMVAEIQSRVDLLAPARGFCGHLSFALLNRHECKIPRVEFLQCSASSGNELM
jgi:hypothetical protein